MGGCCRVITDQISTLDEAKHRLLSSRGSTEALATAVTESLDAYRSILGTYRVSSALTTEFRQNVEPLLAEVWTRDDLSSFTLRLHGFGSKIRSALLGWKGQYCKERAVERVTQAAVLAS